MSGLAKAVVFSLGGVLVGSLHAAASRARPSPREDSDHIQQDSELRQLWSDIMGDFQRMDPVASVRTLQGIEELLALRGDMGTRAPSIEDRALALDIYTKVKEATGRFMQKVTTNAPPREVVRIQRTLQRILRRVDHHMHYVIIKTRDVHMQG